MKSTTRHTLVLVTAPDLKAARGVATAILKEKLAACVNLVPRVESHYWWQEKLERAEEVLMLVKTTRESLEALEKVILAEHPYDTPEIITIEISRGNRRYLEWLSGSVKMPNRKAQGARR